MEQYKSQFFFLQQLVILKHKPTIERTTFFHFLRETHFNQLANDKNQYKVILSVEITLKEKNIVHMMVVISGRK